MASHRPPPALDRLAIDARRSPRPVSAYFDEARSTRNGFLQRPPPGTGFASANGSSSALTSDEIADSLGDLEDGGDKASTRSDKRAAEAAAAPHGIVPNGYADECSNAAALGRKTSISFDSQVTLDGGCRLALQDPLPKPFRQSRGALAADGLPVGCDARSGRRGWPKDLDQPASLTSATTASPAVDELRTPLESSDFLQSPLAVSSSSDAASQPSPLAWPYGRRPSERRSRSYRGERSSYGSTRRNSRRNSAGSSSMSPAGAFLYQWTRQDSSAVVEPDDEGQEFGDNNEYIVGTQIGSGGFGDVKKCYTIEDGEKICRAVKIVRKRLGGMSEDENDQAQARFEHEVSVWRHLSHRYVLPLLGVYDSDFATFCIMQLNRGGTLFDLVRSTRKAGRPGLEPHLAKRYIYQTASALRYLHEDARLVHRDIKLENCLVDMSAPRASREGGDVLLCDFGMADYIVNEHRIDPPPERANPEREAKRLLNPGTYITGSLPYAAPELFAAKGPVYSPAADVWAFGVLSFTVLAGDYPFAHDFEPKLAEMIQHCRWNEDVLHKAPAVQHPSDAALHFVRSCLEKDPSRRATIRSILEHPWLQGCREKYEPSDSAWA